MKTKNKPFVHELLKIYMILCTVILTAYLIFLLLFEIFFTEATAQQKDWVGTLALDLTIPRHSEDGQIKKNIKSKRAVGLGEGKVFLEDVSIEEMDSEGKVKNTQNMDYGLLMGKDQEIIEIKSSNKNTALNSDSADAKSE